MASDEGIHGLIEALIQEEQDLHAAALQHEGLTVGERARLEHVETQLDRLWDLARQRNARREAGLDPDAASIRDEDTVEHYEQ